MKRLSILLLAGLFAQVMVSCYPQGADNIEDYDVAITNYDKSADFTAFKTFAIPDTVVYFSNDRDVQFSHAYDDQIVELVTKNFTDRGYQLVDTTENPSFIVSISAFSNVNYSYYIDNWYNNWSWYWGPWWGGSSFYPYYPWYPVSVYAYRSGSLVIDMISTTPRADGKLSVLWSGVSDGVLQGSGQFIINRTTKLINQCFAQSPYLHAASQN